jgi:hypothetical protein
MGYFLLKAGGLLAGSFPWSVNAVGESSASEATVASTFDTAFLAYWDSSGWNTMIPETTTLTYTSASTASATFTQTTKTETDHSTAGGGTADALPYRTAVLVTFRSVLATRYGRGRWYLPGPTTAALASTGYQLSSTAQGDLVTAMGAFFTALGSTITLQILHRKGALGGAVSPYSLSPVVTSDCPNTFGNQRRRADKLVPTRSSIGV